MPGTSAPGTAGRHDPERLPVTSTSETSAPETDQELSIPSPRRTGEGERWIERLGWEETG